jgi:hypothetical protein
MSAKQNPLAKFWQALPFFSDAKSNKLFASGAEVFAAGCEAKCFQMLFVDRNVASALFCSLSEKHVELWEDLWEFRRLFGLSKAFGHH